MKKQLLLTNILVLFFFISDRVLKKIALDGVTGRIGFFQFSQFGNPYIALSIPLKGSIFYFLLAVILGWLILGLIKSYQQAWTAGVLGFSLILAGTLSNILDRLRFGEVIDYFDLPFFTVFNLADLMILSGVFILIWQMVFVAKSAANRHPL